MRQTERFSKIALTPESTDASRGRSWIRTESSFQRETASRVRSAAAMGWATAAIERLKQGQTVTVRPHGHSMAGKVDDGDTVTVEPVGERELRAGDIALCKVRGREYLHLVKAVQGQRYLIGNNRGGVNGWVGRAAIFGVAAHVERSR